jgi:PAT family beta-lactamase induction signal transducer AmpG
MRLPNLLATARGRLLAFFLLYTTEGVPLGFAAVAVATQLRRMGVGPAEIGAFVAAFYLPWAFKWAFGPLVDVFRSRRWGHRRAWILGTQLGMVATLLAVMWVPLPQGLAWFTAILFMHNLIAATQDVAIDALAVNALAEHERGLANGLMFAGASVGQAIGGAGVLVLIDVTGLRGGIVAVAAAILAVTVFVVLPMKEAFAGAAAQAATVATAAVAGAGAGLREAFVRMRGFTEEAFRSFLGNRGALFGVWVSLLPAGAMSLSSALQSNLAVELGMSDDAVALMSLVTNIVAGLCMVLGGWVADRLGRRRMLALYTALMSLPVLYLAWVLHTAGYAMPRAPGGPAQPELIGQLWIATVGFTVALGLMYGTRTAVFMDVTNPAVAGTQFTAYMAMQNLAIAFAATWQGVAIEKLGYPVTLMIDAAVGLAGLALLPWLVRPAAAALADAAAEGRARTMGRVLAAVCVAFVAWWWLHDRAGAWTGVANTVFTLAFVASALYLAAGGLLQQQGATFARVARALALALLLLYARRWVPELPMAAQEAARVLVAAVALAAAAALWRMAARPWPGLAPAAAQAALSAGTPVASAAGAAAAADPPGGSTPAPSA